MRFKLFATAAVLAAAAVHPAQAQTVSGNFQVSITILKACTLTSATNMAFGSNDGVIAANIDQTSTITVLCTGGTPYNIGLNAGTTPGTTETTRQMSNGGTDRINYGLYKAAGRTAGDNWGNAGLDRLSATAPAIPVPVAHTVYGRVPVQTATATGGYTDTITVTVTY